MAHTPGPWKVFFWNDRLQVEAPGRLLVATCSNTRDDNDNANLIAAAPDFLAALAVQGDQKKPGNRVRLYWLQSLIHSARLGMLNADDNALQSALDELQALHDGLQAAWFKAHRLEE